MLWQKKVSKKKIVGLAKQQNVKVMGLFAGRELKEPKSQLGQPYYWARPLKLHISKSTITTSCLVGEYKG